MICPEVGERVQPLWRAHAAVARQGPDDPQGGGGTTKNIHPGGNPGANRWFIQSTPIQMPPESGDICGRLTQYLPLGYLQGGI